MVCNFVLEVIPTVSELIGVSLHSRVIVGSPKANSTKFRNIQEPGLLWRCSLGKANGDSCDILEMDNHGNESKLKCYFLSLD